ncbi:MAG: hypothetical protein ABJJ44_15670 [Paraglaciecola sp.]|uniref:hypothetical protein n=1 Tax=Paraglaciecola sp. TaxID=1920173 RepID=UPI0032986DA9
MINILLLLISLAFSTSVLSTTMVSTLKADGANQGLTAYELIQNFGGKRSIESPDLYPDNHTSEKHIYEDSDNIVGNHFVFVLHRDLDKDRDKYIKFADRQRNEIKAYSGSKVSLKGFEGETMTYRWKFKLEAEMSLSKNFSHFFQLKSVDDGIGMPILTISARSYRGDRWLALSHAPIKKAVILDKTLWPEVADVWLEAECTVTYRDNGALEISVKRMSDKQTVLAFKSENIDMWRGTQKDHFVRPKWGFYRSLKSKHMLVNEQDSIRFADFEVVK